MQPSKVNTFQPTGNSTLINWISPYPVKGLLGGIFHLNQILMEHSVSKQ